MTASKKRIKNIGIFLKDESGEEEEEEEEDEEKPSRQPQNLGRGKRTAILDSKLRVPFSFILILFDCSNNLCSSLGNIYRRKTKATSKRIGLSSK